MRKVNTAIFLILFVIMTTLLCGCSSENGASPASSTDTETKIPASDDLTDEIATDDDVTSGWVEETGETESTPVDTFDETTADEEDLLPLSGVVIVLDPGHGKFSENYQEQVAPWSSETKKAFSTGTAGSYMSEADFNLKLALKLKPLLEEAGATVYMTREDEYSISNIARAEFANELNADLAFRIHADGSDNSSAHGISMLVPAYGTIGEELENRSREIGEKVLYAMVASTGANNRGVKERSDLTGFNWSKVPVILAECGFMSNPEEDALLASDAYQQKLAEGIYNGIFECFG